MTICRLVRACVRLPTLVGLCELEGWCGLPELCGFCALADWWGLADFSVIVFTCRIVWA